MKRLIVAAGGGGDAVAAAMLHAALYAADDEPALILTYSWDRLIVDPVPGPRAPADFTGLRQLTPHVWAVPGTATPKPPHAATLPRLAAELPHAFALVDPYAGATGITRQLDELTAHFTPHTIDLLDVGGDILAHGDEPTLRSPLADALTLAACIRADAAADIRLLVAGPGLDGELSADTLRPRLGPLTATLTPEHVRAITPILNWHPSEATALLAATALGARGLCEVRDAGLPVPLTAEGPTVHRVDLATAFSGNRLARAIAATTTLDEAEEHCRTVCGTSEIDYERTKAQRLSRQQPAVAAPRDLLAQINGFEQAARTRGATHATVRRLTEALGLTGEALQHLARLNATRASPLPATVWKLQDE
ncbi:DUF1152 domain-containing protein [Streptomyces sp. AN091965]|uniref:DUF1152 domain-containing protein n=1 Tax=Streptomyces sp. AN091965 TaxID=2927803 RepID=UPI001F615357|nr:DUF1152 domain-containing protein [Streptomyces sp. AN091965]MCI3931346.1 DUF1152 domain-containing protein [Streptomyces sp. AN091965]